MGDCKSALRVDYVCLLHWSCVVEKDSKLGNSILTYLKVINMCWVIISAIERLFAKCCKKKKRSPDCSDKGGWGSGEEMSYKA